MEIKILGTGCPNCNKLEQNTKQALDELKMETQIEKVTEIQDIINYGVMNTPALIIDGEIKLSGHSSNVEKIKQLILDNEEKNHYNEDAPISSSGCCCGGC